MKKVLVIAIVALFATSAQAETLVTSLNSPVAKNAFARGEQVCTGWSTHGNRMCVKKVAGKEVFDFQRLPETPVTTIVVKVKSQDCADDLDSPDCADAVAVAAMKALERKASLVK
jgi:hypothetical protein